MTSFEKLLTKLERRQVRLQTLSDQLANRRLLAAAVGIVTMIAAYFTLDMLSSIVAFCASTIIFVVFLREHRRVKVWQARFAAWQTIKRRHGAAMTLKYDALPRSVIPTEVRHPFEKDLDLDQLHRVLDTAITVEGSQRLHQWLLPHSPNLEVIHKRQTLVRELIPRHIFRDKLAMSAKLCVKRRRWQGARILDWFNTHEDVAPSANALRVMVALSLTTIALFVVFILNLLPPFFLIPWVIYLALFYWQRKDMSDLLEHGLQLRYSLEALGSVFGFIETERMPAKVAALSRPIREDKPSGYIRRLSWTLGMLALQQNPIYWVVINSIVPWDMVFAAQLSRQRQALQKRLPLWLDVWFELEALCALATFAHLNPTSNFPTFIDTEPVCTAKNIGHPLIRRQDRVSNDFTFNSLGELGIVTGSNMSGKSSFLRTLGVNLSLAYAGGTVIADDLQTSLFRLFTSIRVTDSLEDGISYFYAEVKRLRALLDALQTSDADTPLFFLVDEIFRGTNNRERLIGSRSYINAVVGEHGVGLVATHDLELIQLAEGNPQITNYHFKEDIAEGEMVFDYQLRAGPSPTTNALHIMQLQGLPVEMPE